MTDYEMMLKLCERLGLVKAPNDDIEALGPNGFFANKKQITIGYGTGYQYFCVDFNFDDAGNVVNHAVWEE